MWLMDNAMSKPTFTFRDKRNNSCLRHLNDVVHMQVLEDFLMQENRLNISGFMIDQFKIVRRYQFETFCNTIFSLGEFYQRVKMSLTGGSAVSLKFSDSAKLVYSFFCIMKVPPSTL